MATINTREYEWKDLTIIIGGKVISGITGVKYSEKMEKEALYGKGDRAIGIQHGNRSYQGEVTLHQSEVEALEQSSTTGSILDLNFDMIICYGNPSKGDTMVTERLINCEFTESPRELKQGDKKQEITLPIIACDKRKL